MYYSGVCSHCCLFFFKQKTAYGMRISDWSSDVCSSDLRSCDRAPADRARQRRRAAGARHVSGRRLSCRCDALLPESHLSARPAERRIALPGGDAERKSVVWGVSVSVRVDLGSRRIIKKKKKIRCSSYYRYIQKNQ